MRAMFLFLAAFGTAAGQIDLTGLATTGDGSTAYFPSTLPLKDEPAQPATVPGRIFRIGPQGFELYLQRTRIDPTPPTGHGQIGFTNYFDLFRPEASRNGSIVAISGHRICSGSSRCASETTLQTTVTGLPGGTVDVTGAGRLSGNGRYLLIYADGTGSSCGYVVDLQNSQVPPPQPCLVSAGFGATGAGRAVADDGTAVTASGSIYLVQGPKVTQVRFPLGSPGEAVIDSAASLVVYSLFDWGTNRRSIRQYRIADQRDAELAAFPGADSHAPYISADGHRVMFLSDASGLPQIYTVPTDSGEPRQVTSDSTGVLSATMSDDGKTAWYFSGSGRLYTVNLDTGETAGRLGRTPQIGYVARMTAGSLYSLPGAGFSDTTYIASAFPLPRSLGGVSVTVNGVDAPLVSVSPTGILLQVPSQTQAETYAQVNTDSSSPFIPKAQFATTTYTALGAFLKNQQSPSAYGGLDALAIHQDWSALITAANPAHPNQIVHFYGTGFGPVDAPPPDGLPAPADPPARTATPVTCWAWGADNATKLDIPVLYSGLAPGLAGVYQLDVRLPASNLRSYGVQLACTGEGDSSNFYGSFAVKP